MQEGRVQHVVLSGDHYLPFTVVKACAETLAGWIAREVSLWHENEQQIRGQSVRLNDEWYERLAPFLPKSKSRI